MASVLQESVGPELALRASVHPAWAHLASVFQGSVGRALALQELVHPA